MIFLILHAVECTRSGGELKTNSGKDETLQPTIQIKVSIYHVVIVIN